MYHLNICISISFFIFICKKVQLHGTALGTTTVSKKSRKVFLFFWFDIEMCYKK